MLRLLSGLVATMALLAVLATGGLVWRLTRGPLDVTGLVQALAAARMPGLVFDNVTLALNGPDLQVTAAGLRAEGVVDGPSLAHASATLEVAALLQFALRPRLLAIDGFHLQITRNADGRFALRGLPGSFALVEPSRAPGAPDQATDSAYPRILGALAAVTIHDASISFTDAASQQSAALRGLNVDLQRDAEGALGGHVKAMMSTGDVTAPLGIDASRLPGETPIAVHVAVGAVNPAVVARLAPALAPLAALDVPLTVTADLALSPGFDLQHATIHAESGPGRAFLPAKGGGTSPGDFASLLLDADGDAHSVTLTRLRVVVAPPSASPPTTVVFTGDAARDANHAVAHGHVTLDQGQMSDLGAIWPVGVAANARNWLVENVIAGSVHDGAFTFTMDGGPDLDDLALTTLNGAMQAENVTLYWLRPVPPIDVPHVLLTMVDADTLTLAAPTAHQGTLQGKQVFMRIWGMSVKDQFSQIDADITAPIADVFTLLQHPRLKLLSVHPLPITGPAGSSATHLTVKLPLESKVTMEAVDIHAASHLTDVRIPRLAAGKPLDGGVFDVDVTTQGLTLNGTARVVGLPSTLAVTMDFRNGPSSQVTEHVTMASRGDDKALSAAGLDTLGLLSGMVSANLDYTEQRDGHAVLKANADLKDAALSTPLGWSKAAGPAASVAWQAQLNHGQLIGFDNIRADGPGLSVRGTSETVDGAPSVLHVEQCVIGRTTLTGTLSFPLKPGDALRVVLSGPQLDISGPLNSKTTFEASTPDTVAPARPYQVDLRFTRVILNEKGEGLGPVSLTASGDDRRIAQAHLLSAGPEQMEVRLTPAGGGRHLQVAIGDMGLLLRRLGAGVGVDQGALTLDGDFDDRRRFSPLTATASVTRFGVHGAPILGKVLQGMTLYGLMDALRGPGLVFDKLTLPFTLENAVLQLREARAYSASLGITAQGWVDLRRKQIDVTGTIVPAYFFNTLLGRMPLIGRLFSPEAGGGVFAATYAMHGASADPVVSVNPLATLTPGALRGLFGLFD
jgi:hypothetical protein